MLRVSEVAFALATICSCTPPPTAQSTAAKPTQAPPRPTPSTSSAAIPAAERREIPASNEAAEVPDEVRWRARWQACPTGQALEEAQSRSLDYLNDSPFSVIRVGPGDTLNLRKASSPSAESLAQLDFQEAGLRWTGAACNVQGVLWFEVERRGARGWVNGTYAQPTSKPRDETALVSAWLSAGKVKTLPRFVEQLRVAVARQQAPADSSSGCSVVTVGSVIEGSQARIVLFVDCRNNDSTSGAQLLVTATEDPAGFRLTHVEWRDVCLRGAGEHCI